jgi:cephalosporin hydroxylase
MSVWTKIAVFGGVASVTGAFLCYNAIQVNLASGSYYKDALRILKESPVAVSALGRPIRATYLDLGNRKNMVTENEACLIIPVSGSKTKGSVLVEASRNIEIGSMWVINSLKLDLASGKEIVIIEKSGNLRKEDCD